MSAAARAGTTGPRPTDRSAPPPRLPRLAPGAALVVLTLVLAAPYAVLGPGWLREDWLSLRNAELEHWWAAAGPAVSWARPVAALAYALTFGLVGDHPLVHHAILTGLNAGVALLLLRLARRFLDGPTAAAVAAAWIVLPSHSSLSRWASSVHIVLALALLLAGTLRLARPGTATATATTATTAQAVVLFALAGLAYEAALVPAAAALVVVPRAWEGSWRWRPVIGGGAVLAAVGAYSALATRKPPPSPIDAAAFLNGNLGWGLVGERAPWLLLEVAVLAGAAGCLVRLVGPSWRAATGVGERMVAVGVAGVVLGALPFAGFGQGLDFAGLDDRANVLSAVGVAVLLVGLVRTLTARPLHLLAAVGLLTVAVLPYRLQQDRDYACTARTVARAVALVDREMGGRTAVVVGPGSIGRGGVQGLNNEHDTAWALAYRRRSAAVDVRYVYTEAELAAAGGVDVRPLASVCGAVVLPVGVPARP